jgi:hypothetical protein
MFEVYGLMFEVANHVSRITIQGIIWNLEFGI